MHATLEKERLDRCQISWNDCKVACEQERQQKPEIRNPNMSEKKTTLERASERDGVWLQTKLNMQIKNKDK